MARIKGPQPADSDKDILFHDIAERLKELRCMYAISSSVSTKRSLGEIFRDTVSAIPQRWQYPEITRGKLRYKEEEWVSESFEEIEWKQSSDIMVAAQPRGSVEVYYLEERPTLDEVPSIVAERNLIDPNSRMLSETLERRDAEKKEQENRALFESYLSVAPDGMAIFDTDMRYTNLNESLANINGISIEDHLQKLPGQILPGEIGELIEDKFQFPLRANRPTINEDISGETPRQRRGNPSLDAFIFPNTWGRSKDKQHRGDSD